MLCITVDKVISPLSLENESIKGVWIGEGQGKWNIFALLDL